MAGIAPITHIVNSVERADPHGLMVRPIGSHRNPAGLFHGLHTAFGSTVFSGGAGPHSSIITGDHSRWRAGLSVQDFAGAGHGMGMTMAGLHSGGSIAKELMGPMSQTNQVGGQIAYHKPG
jgi:hypothetical protein